MVNSVCATWYEFEVAGASDLVSEELVGPERVFFEGRHDEVIIQTQIYRSTGLFQDGVCDLLIDMYAVSSRFLLTAM